MVIAGLWFSGAAGCDGGTGPGTGGAGGEGGSGGSTMTEPRCSGTAEPCVGRSSFNCDGLLGCNEDGACLGEAAACESILEEVSCAQQYGCVWTPSKAKCEGAPAACGGFMKVDLCAAQSGCTWQSGVCGGYPYPCEQLTNEGLCYGQPGCDWQ